MKSITERRMKTLGFNCYYDLKTGDMRSQGGELMDWCFTAVLMVNLAYRTLMWKLFYKMVMLDMEIIPDEGEELKTMYALMADLIEENDK